jgi:hypothetical protein
VKLAEDGIVEEQHNDDMDWESLIRTICEALNNVKALLVSDKMEALEGSDKEHDLAVLFLSNLFRKQCVRVLLTGHQPLGIPSIGGVPEQPYLLGPLDFQNTVRLFANLCQHLHSLADRQQFVKCLVVDEKESKMLPSDKDATQRTKQLFHMLGDGIPSRIEKAAYSISSDELKQLVGLEDVTAP